MILENQENSLFVQMRLREIFDSAVEFSNPRDRSNYLETACQGSAQLRQRIDTLLKAHDSAGEFLESPIDPLADGLITNFLPLDEAEQNFIAKTISPSEGDEIGAYILEERLGEGGFGIVYSGVHRDIKRKVAVKLIKPGMDTRHVISRFNRERISLSVMNHVGIARIYEAGSTENGLPYFIMELVNGSSIMEYCNQHKLTVEQRVEFLAVVCDAIAHAHQKGVIHRDLKPGNILVEHIDGVGVPKVIDFGISKTSELVCENSGETGSAQLMGTPLYMSPEQASFESYDIDVRTDVYALGILLYELVAGSPPALEPGEDGSNIGLILKRTREGNKVRIRQRLKSLDDSSRSAVSLHRSTSFKKLIHTVSDDLEGVAAKALEVDRDLRYDSVAAFAKDLRNFLSDTPVEARPAPLAYRARKFYQRNTTGVLLASTAVAAMLVATWLSIWFVMRAHRAELLAEASVVEKRIAEKEQQLAIDAEKESRERSESIEVFISNLFSALHVENSGPDVTLAEVLLTQRKSIGRAFRDNPELRRRLRDKAARFYSEHGRKGEFIDDLRDELRICQRAVGDDHAHTLELKSKLASELLGAGRWQEAAVYCYEVAEGLSQEANNDKDDLVRLRLSNLNQLAEIHKASGQLDEAINTFQECRLRAAEALGPRDMIVLLTSTSLAHLFIRLERYEEAEKEIQKTHAIARQDFPDDYPLNISLLVASSSLHLIRGEMEESLKAIREAVHHSGTTNGLNNVLYAGHLRLNARVEQEAGHYEEAIILNQKSLGIVTKIETTQPEAIVNCYKTMAEIWAAKGDTTKEIECLEYASAIASKHLPPNDRQNLFLESRLIYLNRNKDLQASTTQLWNVFHRLTDVVGEKSDSAINMTRTLASLYCQQEEFGKAAALLLEAAEISESLHGDSHPMTINTLAHYSQVLKQQENIEHSRVLKQQENSEQRLSIVEDRDSVPVQNEMAKTETEKNFVALCRWAVETVTEKKLPELYHWAVADRK